MILPSISLGLVLLNVASAFPSKRLTVDTPTAPSAAQAAALLLNQSLAYQICVISAGSFAAVQAIKGTKLNGPICVAPIIPRNIPVVLKASGCITSYDKGNTSSTACYNNAGITSTGSIINEPELSGGGYTFAIHSSNSSCSGIQQPFVLSGASDLTIDSTNIIDRSWNVDCTTGVMSPSDPTRILCSILNVNLFVAIPGACVSNLTLSAVGL